MGSCHWPPTSATTSTGGWRSGGALRSVALSASEDAPFRIGATPAVSPSTSVKAAVVGPPLAGPAMMGRAIVMEIMVMAKTMGQ